MGRTTTLTRPKPVGELTALPGTELSRADVKRYFAEQVNSRMQARGWNQADLAREASKHMPRGKEIGRDLVSNWVNQRTLARDARLKAVAKAFDCHPHDLMPQNAMAGIYNDRIPVSLEESEKDGFVRLRIDQLVPWAIALDVLKMLKANSDEEG
jgi:transcriptional regulator with XRE-family HTH domain